MGFWSGLHKLENKVLGNDVIKYLDPGAYFTNADIQKRGPKTTLLGGLWEQQFPKVAETPAVSEDATAAAAKRKAATDARARRQGSGPGSTLLTGADDVTLGRDSTLGNG